MSAYLAGFGLHVPERIVTNAEIAARTGKTAEWIEAACGIRERRWASAAATVADLATAAGEDCLRQTGVSPADIGMLILASGSGSKGFPGPAVEVAARLGLGQIPALDIPMASAGSLFGLDLAQRYAARGTAVLVIGAEKMSALIGAHGDEALNPNTAILFGDGAGAALVTAESGPWKILDAVLHSDGQFREDLKSDGSTLTMNGLSVIMQASRKIPAVVHELLTRQNLKAEEIQQVLCHQANLNLLTRVAKTLNVDEAKVFTNLQRYGNTSSASLLIAAAEWWQANPGASGPIVFAAFGAGLHWGALAAVPR
jgi:3-oxoacyl-[acyl-carrier-protein] synthase-3